MHKSPPAPLHWPIIFQLYSPLKFYISPLCDSCDICVCDMKDKNKLTLGIVISKWLSNKMCFLQSTMFYKFVYNNISLFLNSQTSLHEKALVS